MGIDVRKLAAAAVVGVLALTGCANDPTVAARVGSVTITDREVEQATQAMQDSFELPREQARPVAFQSLMRAALGKNLAISTGHQVTPAERNEVLAGNQELAAMASNDKTRYLANEVADSVFLMQKMGQEKLTAEVASLPVDLNPRYGKWNPNGSFGGSGSLSVKADPAQP